MPRWRLAGARVERAVGVFAIRRLGLRCWKQQSCRTTQSSQKAILGKIIGRSVQVHALGDTEFGPARVGLGGCESGSRARIGVSTIVLERACGESDTTGRIAQCTTVKDRRE